MKSLLKQPKCHSCELCFKGILLGILTAGLLINITSKIILENETQIYKLLINKPKVVTKYKPAWYTNIFATNIVILTNEIEFEEQKKEQRQKEKLKEISSQYQLL